MKFIAKNEDTKIIEVYTDGGCRSTAQKKGSSVNHDDKSAYAFFLKSGGKELLKGGADRGKTNNYMEIKAVVEALKHINNTNLIVDIKSDSMYVVDSINKGWMKGWKNRGWKKSDNSVPANVELWNELDEPFSRFPFIAINHVKGHNGDTYNELVDKHVNDLMDQLENQSEMIIAKEEPLTFEEVQDDWVNKKIKSAQRASIILQEAYELLESENFHSSIEAIEMLTGIKYNKKG